MLGPAGAENVVAVGQAGAGATPKEGDAAGDKESVSSRRGQMSGCDRYRDRAVVESELGWPPALLDKLEDFLTATSRAP